MSAEDNVDSKTHWLPKMDRNDVVGIIGAVLVTAGLWMIYPPAALIVLGCGLVTLALLGASAG